MAMRVMRSRIVMMMGLVHAMACGDAADVPPDAPPDTPAIVDMDHDGHPASQDCDDRDPNVWQNLSYGFRDADGDGHTVAQAGTVCSGASLPKGYSLVASDPDCDDTDPTAFTMVTGFLDIDGDEFGDGMAMTF